MWELNKTKVLFIKGRLLPRFARTLTCLFIYKITHDFRGGYLRFAIRNLRLSRCCLFLIFFFISEVQPVRGYATTYNKNKDNKFGRLKVYPPCSYFISARRFGDREGGCFGTPFIPLFFLI